MKKLPPICRLNFVPFLFLTILNFPVASSSSPLTDFLTSEGGDVKEEDERVDDAIEEEGPAPAAEKSEDEIETILTEPEGNIDEKYSERLRTIEEQINKLKEQVFRSKARLLLLKETVLHGVISGARASIYFSNDMGKTYRLVTLNIYLDGTLIFSQEEPPPDFGRKEKVKVYDGAIAPGSHTIIIHSMLRGYGYGIFSYLNGYKFNVKSSYAFVAEEGKITLLNVITYEKGGLFTEFDEKPDIKYELSYEKNLPESEKSGEKRKER